VQEQPRFVPPNNYAQISESLAFTGFPESGRGHHRQYPRLSRIEGKSG